jgi:hypothetical protein
VKWLGLCVAVALAAPARGIDRSRLALVKPERLKVTAGAIDPLPSGVALITRPKVRAVMQAPAGDSAELRFRFLGRSPDSAPLAYGVARRQLGLKLRAQDACNVLYVMWRLDPVSELAVAIKRNPGQARSAECGPHGYHHLPLKVPLPPLVPGEDHSLRADLRGEELAVRVDGRLVWRGAIDLRLCPLTGPVGMRTDNVMVAFQLEVEKP